MIHVIGNIPKRCYVAVSGGLDSMAALDFLRRTREVFVLHYNHGTGKYADAAEDLVRDYCSRFEIPISVGLANAEVPTGVSKEAWWREKRYAFFEQVFSNSNEANQIITCHHLDDTVETYLFTGIHGKYTLIPHKRDMYLRPFLTTRKKDFQDWCVRKSVPYVQDPSNTNVAFRRNYIRHKLMEHVMMINPGIHKTIKKKVLFEVQGNV